MDIQEIKNSVRLVKRSYSDWQSDLSTHFDKVHTGQENGKLFMNNLPTHRTIALIEMFKRANNEICLYTDRPGEFLNTEAINVLETVCNRGVKLNIVVGADKDPTACGYSKQDEWVWQSLKKMATTYKLLPSNMQECRAELIIADNISHFAFSRLGGGVISTRLEDVLSHKEFFNRMMSKLQPVVHAKPMVKQVEPCRVNGG